MDNFSVLMNEPSFKGSIKFRKAHLYDVNTGRFLAKKRRPVIDTNEIASITDASLWSAKNTNPKIKTLIQVIDKNNQNIYYGVLNELNTVVNAYMNVRKSDNFINLSELTIVKKIRKLFHK